MELTDALKIYHIAKLEWLDAMRLAWILKDESIYDAAKIKFADARHELGKVRHTIGMANIQEMQDTINQRRITP